MRDYSKFFTPKNVADKLVELSFTGFECWSFPPDNLIVLEPSAGNGRIVKAIKRLHYDIKVAAIEVNTKHYGSLIKDADYVFIGDFLQASLLVPIYDCVIANPPFGNGIDLGAHLLKMVQLTKEGGRVVSIVPLDYDCGFLLNYSDVKRISKYDLDNWAKNSDGSKTEIKIQVIYK